MKAIISHAAVNRRVLLSTLAALPALAGPLLPTASNAQAQSPERPLDSWNDGPAKQAILDFVRATTDPASPTFVQPEERIATFDQDGTLWVEHPMYSQVMFCAARFPLLDDAKREYAYGPARAYPTPRSAPSRRRSTTKQKTKAGRSSA
jgi:hypothetical protein